MEIEKVSHHSDRYLGFWGSQAKAIPVIWTQAISPAVVSRLSALAAEHKLPFNPKKNIVVLEDAGFNNLLKEGL